MNVGELRKALENLPDDMPVVYAWTWLSPRDLCVGRRRGSDPVECLLLDGNLSAKAEKFGNTILWQEVDELQAHSR
jgi:hypothetical protein